MDPIPNRPGSGTAAGPSTFAYPAPDRWCRRVSELLRMAKLPTCLGLLRERLGEPAATERSGALEDLTVQRRGLEQVYLDLPTSLETPEVISGV